jgi:ankyrin repeat protein
MANNNDNDRDDQREGIDKVFGQITDAFGKLTQPRADKPPADAAAFFRAVKYNKAAEVKKFIDDGVDLNAPGAGGDTALHLAARNNATDAARLLLEAGANPKAPHGDDPKRTPLADAVNFGKADMAELLTRFGGYTPGERTSDGFTLLHRACEKNNPNLVAAMISAGADGNETTGNGATPLLVAIARRHPDVADRLLDFPAVAQGINEYFVQTDAKKRTAFQLAVERGQAPIVGKMLKFGSNVNAADADGVTPLQHAILKSDISLVRTLIANGADLNKPDSPKGSALFMACQAPEITDGKTRGAIVALLLNAGADPDQALSGSNMTPLHAAALSANGKEAVAALLKYPLDKERADSEGFQPVFYTIHKADTDLLRQMLDAGANPNARQMDDARTPLIHAVHERSPAAVSLLLSRGANPKLFDAHGRSALSYARETKQADVVALLETALNRQAAPKSGFKEWNL